MVVNAPKTPEEYRKQIGNISGAVPMVLIKALP
jgi:hypothetical protein